MNEPAHELFPDTRTTNPLPARSTGVVPAQTIQHAIQAGIIEAIEPIHDDQIQPSSLDLRLGPTAYRVPAGFLPGSKRTVQRCLQDLGEDVDEINLTNTAVLEKNHVYIIPLMESLNLPRKMSAKANPKSSTGRLDIFTRLIADCSTQFDKVPDGHKGRLYIEVCPKSFSVRICQGQSINQIRFIMGSPVPSDTALRKLHHGEGLVFDAHGTKLEPSIDRGLTLSVDLEYDADTTVVGYVATHTTSAIDISKIGHYDFRSYWEPIERPANGQILIEPDRFYILASKEHVRIPAYYAAEMLPFDASIGEFRAHYAGFFDPGFGEAPMRGVRAVLEVKAHSVPFYLRDGQIVAKLIYENMADTPDRVYGRQLGSSYHSQSLTLSKQFVGAPSS